MSAVFLPLLNVLSSNNVIENKHQPIFLGNIWPCCPSVPSVQVMGSGSSAQAAQAQEATDFTGLTEVRLDDADEDGDDETMMTWDGY